MIGESHARGDGLGVGDDHGPHSVLQGPVEGLLRHDAGSEALGEAGDAVQGHQLADCE